MTTCRLDFEELRAYQPGDDIRAIDGIRELSLGLRTTGDVRIGGRGAPFEFLAIEPREFSEIGVFRGDYAARSNELLLSDLEEVSKLQPLLVPESAKRVGLGLVFTFDIVHLTSESI